MFFIKSSTKSERKRNEDLLLNSNSGYIHSMLMCQQSEYGNFLTGG